MLIYAQIEDGIIERVKSASESNALGYRLAHVDSYGGEFDDEAFFTNFRKFPAVWVTIGGEKVRRLSARQFLCAPTIAVMVGTRNVRGERHTRRGSVGELGSYQLLDDVRQLLAGQTLGLPISPLVPGAVRTLFNVKLGNEARSVFAHEFATDYVFAPPAGAGEGDLERIGLTYLLKPGDETADADDLVTLRNP